MESKEQIPGESPLPVGCIGCGNMGGAIMAGLAATCPNELLGYNRTPEKMRSLMEKGVKSVGDMRTLAAGSDIIILALKPYLIEDALRQIHPVLTKKQLIISIAAGVSLETLSKACDSICPVVRVMPNTPALVGKGIYALCFEDPKLTDVHKKIVFDLFSRIGLPLEIPETKFTAFSALIGAGPAYVFQIMQALVQAGVTLGFSHADSRHMVDALLEGCAAMAAQNNTTSHMVLRDQVCSPAGLTIAGVNHLDRTAVSGNIIDAVLAADERGREMES